MTVASSVRHAFTGRSVPQLMRLVAVVFIVYLALHGAWWREDFERLDLYVTELALSFTIALLVLFVGRRDGALPFPVAAVAVLYAPIAPVLVWMAEGTASAHDAPSSTAYIGQVGAIMTIMMVRRRALFAWAGTAALLVSSGSCLGFAEAASRGMVGSIIWVLIAQLLVVLRDRAQRDTAQLLAMQQTATAWQAVQRARRRERREHAQYALSIAGPILKRVLDREGNLDDDERLAARIAEGALRDEMRGARLLDDEVRRAIADARARGAHVIVIDEGGLQRATPGVLALMRAELAQIVRDADVARLIVRSSERGGGSVTVVGRNDDGEDVAIWREISIAGDTQLRHLSPEIPTDSVDGPRDT